MRRASQPRMHLGINRESPLTRGLKFLVNCGLGGPGANAVNGKVFSAVTGAMTTTTAPGVLASRGRLGNGFTRCDGYGTQYNTAGVVTIAALIYDLAPSSNSDFFGQSGSSFVEGCATLSATSSNLEAKFRSSSTTHTVTGSARTVWKNKWVLLGFTADGTTLRWYENGKQIGTTAAGLPTTASTNALSVGSAFNDSAGICAMAAMWWRVLGAAELQHIAHYPWHLFADVPTQRSYHLPSSNVALVGLSYAVATDLAQATLSVAVAGTAAAVATNNAGATLAAAVAGLIASKATNAGAILEGIAVSGLSSAVASDTGAVLERVALGGLSSAVATDTGTVLEALAITGGSFAVATDTGTLGTGAQVGLSGLIGAVATCKGTLTVAAALQGASSAVASLGGGVSLQVGLAGGTFAAAALTGNLVSGTQLTLSGLSAAVATNKGTLGVAIALGGASGAVATLGGTLTQAGRIALGGLSAARATLIGTLTVQGRVIPAEHFDVVFDMRRVLLGADNRRALIAPDTRRTQLEADGRRTTLQVDE